MTNQITTPYEGWSRVELLGHRVAYGYAREIEMFGVKMLEIETPAVGDAEPSKAYYGAGAIYCLTPISQEQVRRYYEPRVPLRLSAPKVEELPFDGNADDADDVDMCDGDDEEVLGL